MASGAAIFGNGHHNISGGNFVSTGNINITNNGGLESIAFTKLESNVVTAALHNSGEISDPPKCHPETRVDVLTILIAWALATIHKYPIRWLNGAAGAGKSAIMRSFAEVLVENGLLLASFFFFRSDAKRNNAKYLISIVYQLYITVPPLQPWIERGTQSNPLIFKASLSVQIQTLIIDPLLHYFYDLKSTIITPFPHIILIDGLDECSGDETQQEILRTFCKMVQGLPIPIAILFASRPEHQIRSAFELGRLSQASSRITLDDSFNADGDVQRFYHDEFEKILCTHPMRRYLVPAWPSPDVIRTLVHNASGQFVYAATVIKFVKSTCHNPALRLQIILGQADRGTSKPFQQLDLLYTLIFLNVDPEVLPFTLRVLGVILTPPLNGEQAHQSPKFMELLLGFPAGHVRFLVLDLESLLTVGEDYQAIRVHHTSLSDFLFDKPRAGDFFTNRGLVYEDIASSCLNLFSDLPVMTSQLLLHTYLEAHLKVSLQRAAGTHRLRRTIISCASEQLTNLPDSTRSCMLTFLFLTGLKESAYHDAEILYKTQLRLVWMSIHSKLVEHWSHPGLQFEPSLLLVLLLALTPARYTKADLFSNYASIFPSIGHSLGSIYTFSVLPDIAYSRAGFSMEEFNTTEDWRSLACVILGVIDRPTGLLRHERWQQQRTDLALHLVQCSYRTYFRPHSESYWHQLEKILPVLLNVSLLREDLISAVRRLQQRFALGSALYLKSAILAAALDNYIQRAESLRSDVDGLEMFSSGSGPRRKAKMRRLDDTRPQESNQVENAPHTEKKYKKRTDPIREIFHRFFHPGGRRPG